MKIKADNAYSDGHRSILLYELPDAEVPGDLLEVDAWGDLDNLFTFLYAYSGDGHGTDNDLGYFHTITIVEAAEPELVGKFIEVDG